MYSGSNGWARRPGARSVKTRDLVRKAPLLKRAATPTALRVLASMCALAHLNGEKDPEAKGWIGQPGLVGRCWPSVRGLSVTLGCGRTAVSRALRWLIAAGFVLAPQVVPTSHALPNGEAARAPRPVYAVVWPAAEELEPRLLKLRDEREKRAAAETEERNERLFRRLLERRREVVTERAPDRRTGIREGADDRDERQPNSAGAEGTTEHVNMRDFDPRDMIDFAHDLRSGGALYESSTQTDPDSSPELAGGGVEAAAPAAPGSGHVARRELAEADPATRVSGRTAPPVGGAPRVARRELAELVTISGPAEREAGEGGRARSGPGAAAVLGYLLDRTDPARTRERFGERWGVDLGLITARLTRYDARTLMRAVDRALVHRASIGPRELFASDEDVAAWLGEGAPPPRAGAVPAVSPPAPPSVPSPASSGVLERPRASRVAPLTAEDIEARLAARAEYEQLSGQKLG